MGPGFAMGTTRCLWFLRHLGTVMGTKTMLAKSGLVYCPTPGSPPSCRPLNFLGLPTSCPIEQELGTSWATRHGKRRARARMRPFATRRLGTARYLHHVSNRTDSLALLIVHEGSRQTISSRESRLRQRPLEAKGAEI